MLPPSPPRPARPANAPRLRPSLAVLLVVAFVAIPYTQALSGLPSLARAPTVEILHAAGGSGEARDAWPAEAAREAHALLAELTRLDVTVRAASDPASFLDAARASRADVLVLVAHGSPSGLEVGGVAVPWSGVREALAQSGARQVLVAACDAALVGVVPGKDVRGLFEGVVDRRLVGPSVAYEAAAAALPADESEAFRPRFYERMGGEAGLYLYATLKLFPQEPMSACRDRLDAWYQGQTPAYKEKDCIHHISPSSLNCHNKANSGHDACRGVTPEQQDQMNSATASAGVQFMPDCSAASWTDCIGNVLQFQADLGGNNQATVKFGIPSNLGCVTLLSLQAIMTGGTTNLFRLVLDSLSSAFTFSAGAGGDVGIKACGSFSGNVDLPTGSNRAFSYEGKGQLDMIAFGEVGVSYPVTVWGYTIHVSVGAEAGVQYPLRPEVKAQMTLCNGGGIGFSADASLDGGPANAYLNAVVIWKELGFSHSFGGTFHLGFRYSRLCPSAPGAEAEPQPALVRGAPEGIYADLVAAGLARVNDAPTIIHVGEDGTRTSLNAFFFALRPGAADWNRLQETGVLARLGVPERLPAHAAVLLDLADPRVREAMGMEPGEPVTTWISLVDGVAIVDGRAALGQATRSFCGDLPGENPELEALACEGVDPTLPLAPATSGGRCDADAAPAGGGASPEGALTTGAYTEQPCAPEGDDPATYYGIGATHAVCDPDPVSLVCLEHDRLVGKDGTVTGLALWARIHNTAKMLERPSEAVVWIEGCTGADVGVDGVASLCLAADAYADLQRAPGAVAAEYAHGKMLLAEYAPSFAKTYIGVMRVACQVGSFQCAFTVHGKDVTELILEQLP